ncbi:uroporphyrinogen decarboxylase family protein [Breznakiellaceae bacterium SP9]
MAADLSPRERMLRSLSGQGVDRPPVICPGGMMNAALVEVMTKTGNTLPAAHHEGELMSNLAASVAQETGFENFGIPFCMTIEAQALGSTIDYGSLSCEPKIAHEAFPSVKAVPQSGEGMIAKNKRAQAVLHAVKRLSKEQPDIPVIGSITGPLSTAASIVDPMTFLRETRRDKAGVHRVLSFITAELIAWAKLIADTGAAAISIADPTATGEILGPKLFAEYALPYLNELTRAVRTMKVPVIIHICGDVRMVKKQLFALQSNALSVDAMVNLAALKEEKADLVTMGNLSTYLLESGEPATVQSATEVLLKRGIDIMAPACGLSTSSPLANIQAFTGTVKAQGGAVLCRE